MWTLVLLRMLLLVYDGAAETMEIDQMPRGGLFADSGALRPHSA